MGFTGCTREQYELSYRDAETGLCTLGPYPERGEYCECSIQLPPEPTRESIIRIIYFIKAGWNYSYDEKKAANNKALEKIEKDKASQFADIFKDSQQAFNNKATSVRPGKKTADKVVIQRHAEDLRLPTRGGFRVSRSRPSTVRISR
jgi:hypothetical protein